MRSKGTWPLSRRLREVPRVRADVGAHEVFDALPVDFIEHTTTLGNRLTKCLEIWPRQSRSQCI